MPLTNAPLCRICKTHHTNNLTGICSLCAKSMKQPRTPCIHCGKVKTRHPSGLCRDCIKSAGLALASPERIQNAIQRQKLLLKVLLRRRKRMSEEEIAAELDIPVNEVYIMIRQSLFTANAIDARLIFSDELHYTDTKK